MKAFRSGGKYTFDGNEYPTVTTILQVISKPALVGWAAKSVAEEAVRRVKNGEDLDVRSLAASPWRARDAKGDIGSVVHSVLESYAKGEVVAVSSVPEDARAHVSSLLEWLHEFKPEVLASEVTVFHENPRYAGTFDAVMKLPSAMGPNVGGRTLLVDVKTGKAVYREAELQLAAYRHANFIGRADSTREDMPVVDGCCVLHVTPDAAQMVEVPADDHAYEAFLAAARLWEYMGSDKASV